MNEHDHLTGSGRAAARASERPDLHAAILSLPFTLPASGVVSQGYLKGHEDARHAAAELVLADRAASAPQQAVREPLTKEKLFTLLMGCSPYPPERLPPGYVAFARAIEAAHGIGIAPLAPAAPTKQGRALPNPGSPEASAMLDSLLAEYQWPANSKNAARAGWEAANRWLAAAPVAAQPADSAMEAYHLNRERSVAVGEHEFYSMASCPRGVKVLLLGPGEVAVIANFDGRDPQWKGWFPLPKKRKEP